ncbi:MAG: ATP-binding protein [Leptolyngbyaceae cyanobacterium]
MTAFAASPSFPEDAALLENAAPSDAMQSGPERLRNPDLLFTLDAEGKLLTLGWPLAEHCGLGISQFLGRPLINLVVDALRPAIVKALQKPPSPTQATTLPCELVLEAYRLRGDLHLHWMPAMGDVAAQTMGLMQVQQVATSEDLLPSQSPQDHSRQLTQLTWKIRRTLNLETIYKQTVDGLGAIFSVDRGFIAAYQPGDTVMQVVAECCQPELTGWQGQTLPLDQYPCLNQALTSPQPIVEAWMPESETDSGPMLVAATRYQDQPNGLIIMHLADEEDTWDAEDLELVSELADQVGTAIAHASLFGESEALAHELQSSNQQLREKHEELEEARHQAEEASRLKSEFLANTSHELRTPLNGMIGFLKLVLDGMADDPEEQQEFINEAHKSALHLLNLINDVLDIAKIEAGKMQIDLKPFNLKELCQAVDDFTRPQAERKGLYFDINLPQTRDEIIVNGNYQRLLQVLLNLVGNAIKFTHEGGITINGEIKLQKVEFQNQTWPGLIKISVIDTGIGVSLEKQDRLFQTFSQVDGERTRQYGGTGLGLAISQKLVEGMGGVVKFISMGDGLGSTVTFTILLYQEPVTIDDVLDDEEDEDEDDL